MWEFFVIMSAASNYCMWMFLSHFWSKTFETSKRNISVDKIKTELQKFKKKEDNEEEKKVPEELSGYEDLDIYIQ